MVGGGAPADDRPPVYKAVGISLAIASGVFIGVSFVLKKKGLLAANLKDNKEAGEGYGYLKNFWWWTGMILMIIGEICNFCAYAFVEAILVTPLGALSVVITAILSSMFLKERLSFVGKIGCFMCIIGSVVIVVNAPSQTSVSTIQDMKHFIISPGFLSYAGVVIVGCASIVIWVAPKYGNKSMLVYLTVCSLIGGLSVVATQGLGAAVLAQTRGIPQFNQWFLYVLLVFVVTTLLVEIVYLNKALNIFNAALVTPTYYVFFTSATIVTSAILFRGFKGPAKDIATVVLGFLQICSGVVLLQLSKSAKDVPDTAIFRGDLDQMHTIAEQSEPESEPKADTIRGTAAIIRRISVARRTAEADEARRIHEERIRDLHTPRSANESIEWDGVRRRVTFTGENPLAGRRRNTLNGHQPPSGAAQISAISEDAETNEGGRRRSMSVDEAMRRQAYPDIEQQLQPLPEHEYHNDSFLERVKGLFAQRSKVSLRDFSASPHRDLRDSTSPVPGSGPQGVRNERHRPPALRNPGTNPSSSNSHIAFESPTEIKSLDFAHVSRPQTLKRMISGESEYTALPNTSPNSTSLDDESTREKPLESHASHGGARRQFSFQNILQRPKSSPGLAHEEGSHHHHHHHHHSPWRKNQSSSSHIPKTEEEMLGLVKGDSSRQHISDDEKRALAGVRVVKDDDEPSDQQRNWESKMREY